MLFIIFDSKKEDSGVFTCDEEEGRRRAAHYFGDNFEKLVYLDPSKKENRELINYYLNFRGSRGRLTIHSCERFKRKGYPYCI